MSGGDSRDGNGDRLPKGSQRVPILVERSAPSLNRPRVADEYERRLYEADRKRAAMYASMEDISDQWAALAERIDELDMPPVPTAIEDDEDSLVTTINAVTGGGR